MGLMWIAGLGCGSLLLVIAWDNSLTMWLAAHPWTSFSSFMGRSLFEGGRIGGGDPGVGVFILAVVVALMTTRARSAKGLATHLYARFLVAAGLTLSLGLVQSLKISIGRVRPELVTQDPSKFTPWYTLGRFVAVRDHFSGSMPSGHTASVLMFVACGYILYHCQPGKTFKRMGLLLLSGGLLAAVLMGITRSMLLKHWISDWLLSIFAGWALIHHLFHTIFNIPYQQEIIRKGKAATVASLRCYTITKPLAMILLFTSLLGLWRYGFS